MDKNGQFLKLSATDALGRTVSSADSYKSGRYVGLFYFIWFNSSQTKAPNVTELLRTNPDELWDPYDDTGIAPPGGMFYFNRPLYGYYSSSDRWVIRKHIELFTMAGIDFLALDLSNDVIYETQLIMLLSVLEEYRQAGWDVPEILCYTNLNSGHTVQMLFNLIYKEGKYKELWFYGPYDKPLMIAHENEITSDEIKDFFYFRPAQWPGYEYPFYENGWPFCDLNRPQRIHQNLIGVSVAQHTSYIFSYGLKVDPLSPARDINHGRGYTSVTKKNGDVNAVLSGANIQEQWDYAISQDPEIIFVTGWNEWATNKRRPTFEGQTVAWFVDSFNTEFSRDIEMTASPSYVIDEETGEYIEEGYGDNYYLMLCDNIRRYKGIRSDAAEYQKNITIDITAGGEQWAEAYAFENMSTDNIPRRDPDYRIAAPVNFIRELKIASDKENIYFLVRTENTVVLGEDPSLLNLLVGVEGSNDPDFEGYQYIINRYPNGTGLTSIESSKGGYDFTRAGEVRYSVNGNLLQVSVPKDLLHIPADNSFTVNVKCTDSLKNPKDIMNYYVYGEVLPLGRFNCIYSG